MVADKSKETNEVSNIKIENFGIGIKIIKMIKITISQIYMK